MAAIIHIKGKERISVSEGVTIEDAILSAGKHPDSFLFLSNGRPVPMTTVMTDGDEIEAVRVASGG